MPIPGRHNVQNALAAIAVALELGISDEDIVAGFAKFDGVKRRFSKVGEVDGAVDHRRLRPSSGRDPGGPVGRARGRRGPRDRGRPAASLHPAPGADGGLPERLQRCRHRVRGAGLSGRRGADRGRRFRRRWPRACARAAIAWSRPSPTPRTCAARCATSRPKATWSSAWAPATSPSGRRAWPTESATARTSK